MSLERQTFDRIRVRCSNSPARGGVSRQRRLLAVHRGRRITQVVTDGKKLNDFADSKREIVSNVTGNASFAIVRDEFKMSRACIYIDTRTYVQRIWEELTPYTP